MAPVLCIYTYYRARTCPARAGSRIELRLSGCLRAREFWPFVLSSRSVCVRARCRWREAGALNLGVGGCSASNSDVPDVYGDKERADLIALGRAEQPPRRCERSGLRGRQLSRLWDGLLREESVGSHFWRWGSGTHGIVGINRARWGLTGPACDDEISRRNDVGEKWTMTRYLVVTFFSITFDGLTFVMAWNPRSEA